MAGLVPSIKNTDLTDADMALIADVFNDYLDNFDSDHELAIGIANPEARYHAIENLYGRLEGIDFSIDESLVHHIDCVCDWCQLQRGDL